MRSVSDKLNRRWSTFVLRLDSFVISSSHNLAGYLNATDRRRRWCSTASQQRRVISVWASVLRLIEATGFMQLVVDHRVIQMIRFKSKTLELLFWAPLRLSLVVGSNSQQRLREERFPASAMPCDVRFMTSSLYNVVSELCSHLLPSFSAESPWKPWLEC